jgi:hypothetical protein
MRRLLTFVALVLVVVLAVSYPAWASWQEEAQREGGLITPLDREVDSVYNFKAAGEEVNLFEAYLGEAGIIGPADEQHSELMK